MEENVTIDKINIKPISQNKPIIYNKITIYTDGSCRKFDERKKRGKISISFIIYFNNKHKYTHFERAGTGSSGNIAEYKAILLALEFLIKNNIQAKEVIFKSDSQSIVNQINGKSHIKNTDLFLINFDVKKLLQQIINSKNIENIKFEWIPREQNKEADELASKPFQIKRKKRRYHGKKC